MSCTCTTEAHIDFSTTDGYGVSVRADRMRARDAYADAIDALVQVRHYMVEHEGVVEVEDERDHIDSLIRRMVDALRVKSDDHSQRLL